MAFEAFGLRLGVRVSDSSALPRVLRLLESENWSVTDEPIVDFLFSLKTARVSKRRGVRNYNLLYAGAGQVERTLDLDVVFNRLREVIHEAVIFSSPSHVFVYASIFKHEKGVVLVPSLGGDDAAIEAFGRQGAALYTRRYAVLDDGGRAQAFPLTNESESLAVDLVAVLNTSDGSDGTAITRPLTAGQVSLALIANSFSVRTHPDRALPTLAQFGTKSRAVSTRYESVEQVVREVLTAL